MTTPTVSRDGSRIVIAHGTQEIWLAEHHAVYTGDMQQCFDYYFGAVVPFRIGDRTIADYSTPRYHCIRGFDDFPVLCPSLAEPYSAAQQYLELGKVKPGQMVLDLGGYAGLTAIAFSKAVGPRGRVVVAEPDPASFSACCTNLALHERFSKLANVQMRAVAIGSACGEVEFSSEGSMGAAFTSIVGANRGRTIEAICLTIPALVHNAMLDHVDFIKMDIEGAELFALQGAAEWLAQYHPRIVVEPHWVGDSICTWRVETLLRDIGYECQVVEQPGVPLPLVVASWERVQ